MPSDSTGPAPVVPDKTSTVRTVAIVGLFVIATLFALHWAQPVLMPIVTAILLHFPLSSFVRGAKNIGIPPALGALLPLGLLVCCILFVVWQLSMPAMEWMNRLPAAVPKIEAKWRELREPLRVVERASEQVSKIGDNPPDQTLKVEIKDPPLTDIVVGGMQDVATFLGATLVLLYFLLATDGVFLRKLVRVLPRLRDRKGAVEVVRDIERDLSKFLLTTLTIGLCVGVAEGIAMWALGMPNALLWAAMGACANWIPYVGAMAGTAIVGVAALTAFDSTGHALLVPAVFFAITAFEGSFVTPLIMGKRMTLNPVILLVWLALWGWMWGLVGALIAVPMLASLRIVCDKLPPLAFLSEFLSDREPEISATPAAASDGPADLPRGELTRP
jgi:predicted PurR-regulated permease PerM